MKTALFRRTLLGIMALGFAWIHGAMSGFAAPQLSDTNKPAEVVRLFFIHHSTGENWLRDDYGRLGIALRDNNYFVSDSNYGWGPDGIGDTTDIGHWYQWFRSARASTYLAAVFDSSDRNCEYSRPTSVPAGPNQVILFKSCFPNSALQGAPGDLIPDIGKNRLRNQDSGSPYHTVGNAKGLYQDLLNCFAANTNKLFVVITAPPLSDPTWADNARAFNQWLVHEWLKDYPYANVFVFDFYNVLTSNGGSAGVSDLGQATGHHHRWWADAVQHQVGGGGNVLAYRSGDDHPNAVGSRKATAEFVPLLNAAVRAWQASLQGSPAPPRFDHCQVTAENVSLRISGMSAGFAYALQRSTDLGEGNWIHLAIFSGVSSTNWSETISPQTQGCYYRMVSP